MAHISELIPDKQNARAHNERNVNMIVSALQEVGAARSIVIDEDGNILAGNATIEAAAEAGIENLQVVDVDGETIVAVRRTGLTPAQKKRLAYFDNRTAELADWDSEQVLIDLDAGVNLDDIFTEAELPGEVRADMTLEEMDMEFLPERPTWALMTIQSSVLHIIKPRLDAICAEAGVQLEFSQD